MSLRVRNSSRMMSAFGAFRRVLPARTKGQSLVEFAIVLPVMLAFLGMMLDVAQVYQRWIRLEQATRDAAQYIATNTDDLRVDWTGTDADTKAKSILQTETDATFTVSSSQTACPLPNGKVTTTVSTPNTASTSGGSTANPVQTVRVRSCIGFQTLFPYPYLTTNGQWILTSDRTYSTIVGR